MTSQMFYDFRRLWKPTANWEVRFLANAHEDMSARPAYVRQRQASLVCPQSYGRLGRGDTAGFCPKVWILTSPTGGIASRPVSGLMVTAVTAQADDEAVAGQDATSCVASPYACPPAYAPPPTLQSYAGGPVGRLAGFDER